MKVQSKQRIYFPVKLLGTKSVFIGVKTPRIVYLYLFIFLSTASTCQTLMINLSSFFIQIFFRFSAICWCRKGNNPTYRYVIIESNEPQTFVRYLISIIWNDLCSWNTFFTECCELEGHYFNSFQTLARSNNFWKKQILTSIRYQSASTVDLPSQIS